MFWLHKGNKECPNIVTAINKTVSHSWYHGRKTLSVPFTVSSKRIILPQIYAFCENGWGIKVFQEKRLWGWLLAESVQSKIANWGGPGLGTLEAR